eukprot:TRINITY_DN890_c0_g1_i2.p1 TRINITY_DN890_c0_g1~~TRINITY_DN890_c0_g1_i2.p1  ORF type:complete len:284 (+),score=66.06 TRINITY_DN890_c0_g1_i2:73-924(+)
MTDFLNTTVGTLLPDDRESIISVTSDQPVSAACEKMAENKVLSLPIYDMTKRRFTSFIDMLDIVSFCVSEITDKNVSDPSVIKLIDTSKFTTTPCSQIANSSKRDPFKPLDEKASVMKAMETIVHWNVHRLPIVDHEGELHTIFTQSHMISGIFKHLSKFGSFQYKSIAELKMKHEGIVSIPANDMAISAFHAMHSKRVSAVAVVDYTGTLVGNISASDWRLVGYDVNGADILTQSAESFLSTIAAHRRNSGPSPRDIVPSSRDLHGAAAVSELNTFNEVFLF